MSSATLSSSPSASSTIDEQLRLRIAEELAGSFKGEIIGPDHADYERGPAGLERHGRPAARPDPALHQHPGRGGRGQRGPRARPAAVGPLRGSQRGGQGHVGRRPDHRPVRAARGHRRSGGQAGARGRRLPARRRRRRDRAAPADRPGRDHVRDRGRRPGARRRDRLVLPQARPDLRQLRLPRGRAGERRGDRGQRGRAPGAVLGAARRRRQLRHRHPLHLPRLRLRPDDAHRGLGLRAGAGGRGAARVRPHRAHPAPHGRLARRAQARHAGAAVRPARATSASAC